MAPATRRKVNNASIQDQHRAKADLTGDVHAVPLDTEFALCFHSKITNAMQIDGGAADSVCATTTK